MSIIEKSNKPNGIYYYFFNKIKIKLDISIEFNNNIFKFIMKPKSGSIGPWINFKTKYIINKNKKINIPDIKNKNSELYKILIEHKLLLKSVKYFEDKNEIKVNITTSFFPHIYYNFILKKKNINDFEWIEI